ncbi:MAG: chemotaxis protein CheR [Acidobacteria bacterium]|nr:MAG: chemotaxis protein CheR [Acidobacteriota bacterium]
MPHAAESTAFEQILDYLRQTRGFDFTSYKRTSLMRRVRRRMQIVEIGTFEAYLDHLQVHPDEFIPLFNTILINVSGFFRDPEVWDVVRTTVIPAIAPPDGGAPVRIWSAGCAGGQEAYTVAMLLAEALGVDGFRERVKIYATDVDEEGLVEARRAVFDEKQLEAVPSGFVDKYFDSSGDLHTVTRDVRRAVIFGRHDLIQDAPISRIDLLLCRNTLMYFNSEAQGRIMARFSFSVNPGGFLMLGRAEMLFSHATLFAALDLKRRLFRSVSKRHQPGRTLPGGDAREDSVAQDTHEARLREAAFDLSADPQIILDAAGTLIWVNAAARRVFGLTPIHLGAPLRDVEISYRPADLRSGFDRLREDRREITLNAVPWERAGGVRFFDVVFTPLLDDSRALLGARVAFVDVTALKNVQDELEQSKQELETAFEELQSTNEELETTNEELQSTVEELETTNEELQSTNEELETMNEELQSTNEELQTMNDELRNRSGDLNAANAFLESVFTSLQSAVVVLDPEFRILVWNVGATELWGVRPDEAERTSFFALDIGLPVKDLHQPIRDVLSGAAGQRQLKLAATSRRGKAITCQVTVVPLLGGDQQTKGVIVLMETGG